MGGLISTYAVFRCPESFCFAGIQSPLPVGQTRHLRHGASGITRGFAILHGHGTIHDALDEARRMREMLTARGYPLTYGEYPEGHNWSNWRARLPDLLTAFCERGSTSEGPGERAGPSLH